MKSNLQYTPRQLMVACAAREIADGDLVFVGMRLPLLAFLLAKSTHAPHAVGIYELGIVRRDAAPAPILTMGDLPNLYRALWLTDTLDVMGLLQQGRIDISFIGGAQVDRFGNLNTTCIGDLRSPRTRLPGSGGGCDLASLSQKHIVLMPHEKRRLVFKVAYNTSPGYGSGGGWRQKVGLPRGGPEAVITTMGILGFTSDSREMVLTHLHPGVSVASVLAHTGWPLRVAEPVGKTRPPTERELSVLHRIDPQGFWTGADPSTV